MKIILATASIVLVAIVTYLAYALDQWLGIVAFTYQYLLFSAGTALLISASWFFVLKKRAIIVALAVFGILAANILLPPPSERILRSALLRLSPGTEEVLIEKIVKEEYESSPYVLPAITKEENRVSVSLVSQKDGNCSAIDFKIIDGVIAESKFIAD